MRLPQDGFEAMTFTDEDLQRVKGYTKRGDIQWEDLIGLLTRLEAAEECAELYKTVVGPCLPVDRWRKAAGKRRRGRLWIS